VGIFVPDHRLLRGNDVSSTRALGIEAVSRNSRLALCDLQLLSSPPLLASSHAKRLFEVALEQARRRYGFWITGYVIMSEHVHLLVSEPERATLAVALQTLKQSVARRLIGERKHFWQARYSVTTTSMCGQK